MCQKKPPACKIQILIDSPFLPLFLNLILFQCRGSPSHASIPIPPVPALLWTTHHYCTSFSSLFIRLFFCFQYSFSDESVKHPDYKHRLWSHTVWPLIPAEPFISCVTLDILLNLSVLCILITAHWFQRSQTLFEISSSPSLDPLTALLILGEGQKTESVEHNVEWFPYLMSFHLYRVSRYTHPSYRQQKQGIEKLFNQN